MARKPDTPKKNSTWSVSARESSITIPDRANPLAKLMFAEMKRQRVSYDELEHRSGVLRCTFKSWRLEKNPGLITIEAALGALGWALVPVPQHDQLPDNIRTGLDALNAEWAGQEPLLHHLLASACLAPIIVKHEGPVVDAKATSVTVRPRRRGREPNPFQKTLF